MNKATTERIAWAAVKNLMSGDYPLIVKDAVDKALYEAEYKLTPVLSVSETCILKEIFNAEYEYIARDKDGDLSIHKTKPVKEDSYWSADFDDSYIICFDHLFKFVEWSDDEPWSIEDLIDE